MTCNCRGGPACCKNLMLRPYRQNDNWFESFVPYQSYIGPLEVTEATMPVGWLCPRCQKVNAPTVEQCSCVAEKETEAN